MSPIVEDFQYAEHSALCSLSGDFKSPHCVQASCVCDEKGIQIGPLQKITKQITDKTFFANLSYTCN